MHNAGAHNNLHIPTSGGGGGGGGGGEGRGIKASLHG